MPASASSDAPVVLITGCSSGIGRATALLFAARGYRVYASMRRPAGDAGASLRADAERNGWALATPALDVTDDASVAAAVDGLLAETGGRIDVLVNNAGYYAFGPLEETSPDELRAQLETNVVGVLRVTRAVLPAMRARGGGAIVNVSSIAGLVVVPVVGAYHASKFAVDALTEALRYEVAPFGIRVVCIEPGNFQTDLHHKEVRAAAAGRPDSPYADLLRAYERQSAQIRRGPPDAVVAAIWKAATAARPRLRWRMGPNAFLGGVLRRFVPDALYELVMRVSFRWGPRRRAAPLAGRSPSPHV
jgi:NAD(P)-dependent dehydrogenase (short-subunit alcohol dehydrogenase family)